MGLRNDVGGGLEKELALEGGLGLLINVVSRKKLKLE